ncbi:uncharacterized protein PRCAT00004784001 [Priceomyces carsonii]|uniref:uncharacterized protein n=1 Tax=Priceomyces carsonii TaxID=28549 RepID=UPI002EDAA08E|nr:unnamed protein product [Priceomyces carsonii]
MDNSLPIVPPKKGGESKIEDLPPLIFGGAVLNTIYTDDPFKMPITEMIDKAFENGIIALDTSPYYGLSEEIFGKALNALKDKWNRESYFLCTKVGRHPDGFRYSREGIRKSVMNSIEKLNTLYLDLVYCHDIEFVKDEEIFEALRELKLLKDENVVKNIGISGYPVNFLYKIALGASKDNTIGPLDAVLSYANGCLQNTILFDEYQKFFDIGVKKMLNGSILSMSLLRSQKTHDFHPAPAALKAAVQKVASHLKSEYSGLELADLSTRFAYRNWLFEDKNHGKELEWKRDCSLVLGVSTIQELQDAIQNYWTVKQNLNGVLEKDASIVEEARKMLGPEHLDETWPSGFH